MSTDSIDPAVFRELQDTAGPEFVAELVDTFLQEAPPLIDELHRALDAGQVDDFRRAAHSLKANALTFGATELAGVARDLELRGLAAVAATGPAALAPLLDAYARAATALAGLRDA